MMSNTSTTTALAGIRLTCRFCGRQLSSFAIMTQAVLGLGGITYCRQCSAKDACERLGIPYQPKPSEGETR